MKCVGLLPNPLRWALFRRKLRIDRIQDPDFVVKIAETEEELEAAFALLHDGYVNTGLMKPHMSGLRCNLYQTLPYTTVIVAKLKGKVVATVSMIKDSPVGLPSDKEFQMENDKYRRRGMKLCEVSAMVVHKDHRQSGHKMSLHVMKYLYLYALDLMDVTMLIAVVHPRSFDFYASLFNFSRNGDVIDYKFVQGAAGMHISMDYNGNEEWMRKAFRGIPASGNLATFMFDERSRFIFPPRQARCVLDPVLTPKMIEEFFVRRTSVLNDLSDRERGLVRSAYELHFSKITEIDALKRVKPTDLRAFRYLTAIRSVLFSAGEPLIGWIGDLSTRGMFFETERELEIGSSHEIVFALDNQMVRAQVVVRWKNETSLRHQKGFGFEIVSADRDIGDLLFRVHHSAAASTERRAQDQVQDLHQRVSA